MSLASWLERIEAIHPKSIDMGLDRIRSVWTSLGLMRPASQVITVGGTNGKGSTVAFLESIARAASWRVGAYTSPHILAFNERIRIDGVPVADELIVAAFERIDAARGETQLTYFEFATLAALIIFEDAGLDLAILEVGLGGRLDATNIVDSDVSIITTVDIDHQDYLGNDREVIGFEKAGIMRAWKPVILGDRDPPSSVLERAYVIGASAIRFNCDYFIDPCDRDGYFIWREPGTELEIPKPSLAAPIQIRNAAIAIAAMRALPESPPDKAYAIGVANASVSARLQELTYKKRRLYLDVAHNPQATSSLRDWSAENVSCGRTVAVFAGLSDKDRAGVIDVLRDHVDAWHVAALDGPRADSLEHVREALASHLPADTAWHESVEAALEAAVAATAEEDRILVFGSFHTVSKALQYLT